MFEVHVFFIWKRGFRFTSRPGIGVIVRGGILMNQLRKYSLFTNLVDLILPHPT